MRFATGPLLALALASWFVALGTAADIAHSRSVSVPVWRELIGLWLAFRHAPAWALLASASGLIALVFLGGSGSISGLPETPDEAKIMGSILVAFLALSLPALVWSRAATAHSTRTSTSPERARERERVPPNKQLERTGDTSSRARSKRAISLCACCALDSAARRRSTAALDAHEPLRGC
jgi:hypothetical protein